MGIGILLADNHRIFRQALRVLLEKKAGLEVVAEAEDGRTAVELAGRLKPDVVVMDVAMPDMNGMEATRLIISCTPATQVVALSIHSDERFVEGMLEAGAKAYLCKDCAAEELSKAVQTVSDGQPYIGRCMGDLPVEKHADARSGLPAELLSPREREVLQLLSEGSSSKQIAVALEMCLKTAENHRHQIMAKLGIHNIADLTKFAIREGLTFLEV